MYLPFEGAEVGIYPSFKGATDPEGFTRGKITINGKEVNAIKNEAGMVLLYMQSENGEKAYYVYNAEKNSVVAKYQPLKINGKSFISVSIPEEMKNMKGLVETLVKLKDTEITGWKFENQTFENFFLVYLMDETGETHIYQYEQTEESLQLYNGGAAVLQTDYDQLVKDYEKMTIFFYVACAVSGIMLILSIFALINANKLKKRLLETSRIRRMDENKTSHLTDGPVGTQNSNDGGNEKSE